LFAEYHLKKYFKENGEAGTLAQSVQSSLTRELLQPEEADLDKTYRFWRSYLDIIYGVFQIGGI